jgi:hypothetical protein
LVIFLLLIDRVLVHGFNTMSLSKASKRWQEKQMERMKKGKFS